MGQGLVIHHNLKESGCRDIQGEQKDKDLCLTDDIVNEAVGGRVLERITDEQNKTISPSA